MKTFNQLIKGDPVYELIICWDRITLVTWTFKHKTEYCGIRLCSGNTNCTIYPYLNTTNHTTHWTKFDKTIYFISIIELVEYLSTAKTDVTNILNKIYENTT